jgi:hypothetical protein
MLPPAGLAAAVALNVGTPLKIASATAKDVSVYLYCAMPLIRFAENLIASLAVRLFPHPQHSSGWRGSDIF